MRKIQELTEPNSCMNRACDTEMTFVLLARDMVAPAVIREWCRLRCLYGKNVVSDSQIQEALACADTMEIEYFVANALAKRDVSAEMQQAIDSEGI